jgi:ankyrin repeat protein
MQNRIRKQEIIDEFVNSAAGDIDTVRRYIKAGGDVNAKRRGVTALYMAASYGSKELVWLLLSAGADPNLAIDTPGVSIQCMEDFGLSQKEMCSTGHFTPLFIAADYGRRDVVQLLLAYGADPNQAIHTYTYSLANKLNFFDTSPLHHAREKGFTEIVQLMKKPQDQIIDNMLRDLRHRSWNIKKKRALMNQNQLFSTKRSIELHEHDDVVQSKKRRG